MIIKNVIHRLKLASFVGALLLLASCSSVLYQASGEYIDDQANARKILMQWKAQKYYIPFVDAKVDYGSVSLQAECLPDVFLDHRNDPNEGFVFVERPQEFKLTAGAPDVRLDKFLVCAGFAGKPTIEKLSAADEARLMILCESKFGDAFLPPNLPGYLLSVEQGENEETLLCQ